MSIVPCDQAYHNALKSNAHSFAEGTKYVGPCDGGVMGNCLRCKSSLILEFDMSDAETLPDVATIRREQRNERK